jgi:hypothetical protein
MSAWLITAGLIAFIVVTIVLAALWINPPEYDEDTTILAVWESTETK